MAVERDKNNRAQWHLPFFCQDGATIRDATINDDQCEADVYWESVPPQYKGINGKVESFCG